MLTFILGMSITINLFFVTAIILWLNFKDIKFTDSEIADEEAYSDFFKEELSKKHRKNC